MKFENVLEVTKQAIAMTMGADYMDKVGELGEMDSYKLVDVGKDVLDGGSVEVFSKSLVSLLGKLEIEAEEWKSDLPSLFIQSFEWGGFLERVYFDLADVIDDDMWKLVDKKVYDNDHRFFQPKVQAKLFEEAKAICVPISMGEEQLKEAFQGWEQMNRFQSGILASVHNTLELALSAYAHMLISCGIAVSDKALGNSVHLLSEAITKGIVPTGTTAEKALRNREFQSYALERIKLTKDRMKDLTRCFNNGNVPTFSKDANVVLHNDFATAVGFELKPNTYHAEDLNIGEYDVVNYWQGINADTSDQSQAYDFSSTSTIAISADASNKLGIGTDAVEVDNVIAFVYGKKALGICPYKRKTTSSYTASADFWNQFFHLLCSYILDSNFGMVAFILD